MQVHLLKNLGTRDWPVPHKAGQSVTVSKEEGEKLCKLGLAEEIKAVAKPAQIKAVPPKPTFKADEAGTKENY